MKLVYEVIARSNTRGCSYNKRDMIKALENVGAVVTCSGMILKAVYELSPSQLLDPKPIRDLMALAIRRVHSRAPKRFLGLKD